MPLTACGTCERLFLWDGDVPEDLRACPRCGRSLELTSVARMGDLPKMRLEFVRRRSFCDSPAFPLGANESVEENVTIPMARDLSLR